MFLSKETQLVAVDIGSHSIKVAQLARTKKADQFELLSFGLMPLEEESVVDGVVKKPDEVAEALTQLIKAEKVQTRFAVSSVSGEAVIVKKIKVPVMSREELVEAINHEAEQYIPFDIDDVRIDFQILEPSRDKSLAGFAKESELETASDSDDLLEGDADDEGKMEILLVAVQKDIIESRTDVLLDAGLKPVIIDLDVFAMVRAAHLLRDPGTMGAVALVDFGDSFTHLNILLDGVSVLVRDIPLGGGVCSRKMVSKLEIVADQVTDLKLGKIPPNIESADVIEIIVSNNEKILEELKKSFEFFNATSKARVESMLISGGGALIRGMDAYFSEKLKVPVEVLDPMKAIKVNPKQFDVEAIKVLSPLSAVALGLATRRFDYAD